ncbi:MAG: hypothetical protein AB6733_08220 [Clostridiaceae bacterium]
MLNINEDVKRICVDLYFSGWIEKNKYPELLRNKEVLESVRELLSYFGLEFVDCYFSKWYTVRLLKENDSYSEYHRYHKDLSSRHLALLLILYSKLILPIKAGQVDEKIELRVTFAEIFQMYGYKFKSGKRKLASESNVRSLFTTLCKLNYIIKPYGQNYYLAGPLMFSLHNELLTDIAEESFELLFKISEDGDKDVKSS